jgi:predicted transcriptional regulator
MKHKKRTDHKKKRPVIEEPPKKQSWLSRLLGIKEVPETAQKSIPYKAMYRDGICKVTANYYSLTIAYEDINYQLAQNEDKIAIFENYCDFLNYYDSTISVQLTFFNSHANMAEYAKNIIIPQQDDDFNEIRKEYSSVLERQMSKGNNGLEKVKYITLGIEAKSIKAARARLDRVGMDSINVYDEKYKKWSYDDLPILPKANTLGKKYTKEQIQERIEKKPKVNVRVPITRLQYLLEVPVGILQNSENAGLRRWATKENLKRMAETYNQMVEQGIGNFEELNDKIEKVNEKQKELKGSLKQMEQAQKKMAEVSKYLKQYQDTKDVYRKYEGAYFRDRFFKQHESELIIYGAAANYFKQQGIEPDKLERGQLQVQQRKLDESKIDVKKQMKKLGFRSILFEKIDMNMREYLSFVEPERQPIKESVDKGVFK